MFVRKPSVPDEVAAVVRKFICPDVLRSFLTFEGRGAGEGPAAVAAHVAGARFSDSTELLVGAVIVIKESCAAPEAV